MDIPSLGFKKIRFFLAGLFESWPQRVVWIAFPSLYLILLVWSCELFKNQDSRGICLTSQISFSLGSLGIALIFALLLVTLKNKRKEVSWALLGLTTLFLGSVVYSAQRHFKAYSNTFFSQRMGAMLCLEGTKIKCEKTEDCSDEKMKAFCGLVDGRRSFIKPSLECNYLIKCSSNNLCETYCRQE